MREIKFRSWDKKREVMDQWNKFDSPLLTFEGELVTTKKTGGTELFQRDYILMQFIGLKDKSGTEIYEGDVVKGIAEIEGQSEVFIDGVAVQGYVEYSPETTDYIVDDWKVGKTESNGHSLSELEEIEVIGNIYDNPELLD